MKKTWISDNKTQKYIGELNKDGLFHGKETLIHPDGKIEKGIWENCKLIKSK